MFIRNAIGALFPVAPFAVSALAPIVEGGE
jgi:hypothetical protein